MESEACVTLADTQYVKLIGQHHPDAQVWPEQTTLVPRDRFPVAAGGSGRLLLVASGDYTGDPEPLQVGIERGGWPDEGARFWWSDDAGATRYGWDEPSTVAHLEPLDDAAGAAERNGRLSMVEDADGSLIVFSSYRRSSSAAACRVYRRTPAASWSYVGQLAAPMLSVSPLDGYLTGWNMNARAAVDESGACFLAIQRPRRYNDGVDKVVTQVDIYRAGGAITAASDMEQFAADVLNTPVVLEASSPGIDAMAFAVGSGQALCIITSADTVFQYAGYPANMRLITELPVGALWPCALWFRGYFIVAVVIGGTLSVVRLASATDSIDGLPSTAVASVVDEAAITMWGDGDTLWLLVSDPDVPALYRSLDAGATWLDAPAQPWRKTGAEIMGLAGHAWQGRSVVVMETSSSPGFENCAASVDLGGWTTVPSPPNVTQTIEQRWFPRACWLGVSDLAGSARGGCTLTVSGSPVRTTLGPTVLEIACGVGETAKVEATGSAAGTPVHFRLRSRFNVTSAIGEVGHVLASATRSLLVRQTDTGLEVVDTISGTTRATITASGFIDLLMWLDDEGGLGHVWYRAPSVATVDARVYVKAWGGLMTAGSVTPGQYSIIGSNCTAQLNGWDYTDTAGSWDLSPTRPWGHPLSTGRSPVANGVMVSGRRGPAIAGDVFEITSASQFGTEYAAATETAPNLGTRFEAVDAADGCIAWMISEDPSRIGPLWLAFIESNAQVMNLDVHDGTSWIEGPDVRLVYTIIGRASGRVVRARATAEVTSLVVAKDDLRGSWLTIDGSPYEIAGNDGGLLTSLGTDGTQVMIRLVEPVAAPISDAPMAICMRQTTVAIPMSLEFGDLFTAGPEIRGFRLRLSGETPPDGRYWLKAAVGPADVLGFSYGMDSTVNLVPRQASVESRGGMRSREQLGPSSEVLTVSWQAAPDILRKQTRGTRTTTPDILTDAYDTVLYTGGTTLDTIRGYMDDNGATGRPVILMETYRVAALVGFAFNHWGGGGLYTLDPDGWVMEHAGHGEEHVNDLVRGGTLQLRRVT